MYRLTNKVLPQLLVAHSLYVVGLYAGKEWVLGLDVGVPWLLIRVLALGGLGFVVWEVKYGQLFASRAIEVRSLCSYSSFDALRIHFLVLGRIVVCRRDGLVVCASTARVVACCLGSPVAYKVRFCPFSRLGSSGKCRVIMITAYVFITGSSSSRNIRLFGRRSSRVDHQCVRLEVSWRTRR